MWTSDRRPLRLPQEDCCQALSVPPIRKYEADGGPGIIAILELLKGSDDPEADQRQFLKTQIIFWMLAAIDGHAKNFSLFLRPGGRFRLTPLYDVMSAQPAFEAGQISKNKMKLAQAVGDNRHYAVDEIVPRHFIQTAMKAGVPAATVINIMEELLAAGEKAVNSALAALPDTFPNALSRSITHGLQSRLRTMERALRT